MDAIPGFVPGIVMDNSDPEGTGRVKAKIPGLMEPMTPYWIMPANWPGAGGVHTGSQYPPPPLNAQIFIMFEYGQYQAADSHAIYLTGYYGLTEDKAPAGPTIVGTATTAANAHKRVCFWEDDKFIAYVINDDTEKRLVLQAKTSGSKVEINAADGNSGKAETIYIEARTALSLYSQGLVDIQGMIVQINGRKVSSLTNSMI